MFQNAKKPDGVSAFGTSPASAQQPAAPFASQDRGPQPNHSIVDERLVMKGDLESDGDILVRGKVIGNIRCKLLIVDSEASVDGGIDAEEVVVRGRTKGRMKAERVRFERSAVVDSEILHRSFSAEEGSRITGALRFIEDEIPAAAE